MDEPGEEVCRMGLLSCENITGIHDETIEFSKYCPPRQIIIAQHDTMGDFKVGVNTGV
jgi:hypothetical protein